VFFNLTFKYVFEIGHNNPWITIGLGFVLWPIFWSITFAIIMSMDALECFLHTLRLHWVEFQNKFFSGKGYAFEAYSYEKVLEKVLED
jgi:V-type H+-transporting ATPase subunit a